MNLLLNRQPGAHAAPVTAETIGHPPGMGLRWLFLALMLFLLQVLPYLSHRWVTDESWYAAPGYSIAHGTGVRDPAIGPNDLENRFDARPPGTALVIAGFFKVAGSGAVQARLGSVLAGLIIVLLTYRLARDVIGTEGAIVATLLVATDNFIVLVSRTARPEALTTMAILLSLLAMKHYRERGSLGWAAGSGVLIAMGTMFHITVLGFVISLGLIAIYLDWQSGRSPLRGAFAYAAGFFAGLLPFATWILTAPLGTAGFRQEYLARVASESLLTKLLHEKHRYLDMFGFNMLHGHGLDSIPVRLPVPLFLLAASFLLWRYKRNWFYLELVLLLPTLAWLVETANKSSRYISIFAPVLALVVGGAVAVTRGRRTMHRAIVALASLLIIAQFGSNLLLLKSARAADYTRLGNELRTVIPRGAPVYGTITFWLALHDQPFISYERTDPWIAVREDHTRYFIVGDRMMTQGVDWDREFYQTMNQHLAEIISRSTEIGHIPDPYYGDLKIYKLRDDQGA